MARGSNSQCLQIVGVHTYSSLQLDSSPHDLPEGEIEDPEGPASEVSDI